MFRYELQRLAQFALGHAPLLDHRRPCAGQIDTGLPIALDMDVRRFVIVEVDNDAQPEGTQNSDHDSI